MVNVRIEHLSKNIRGVRVLDDISMTMESDQIVGLSGINGSGKTMLMRAICGLIKPTSGKIFIDGKQLGRDIEFPQA